MIWFFSFVVIEITLKLKLNFILINEFVPTICLPRHRISVNSVTKIQKRGEATYNYFFKLSTKPLTCDIPRTEITNLLLPVCVRFWEKAPCHANKIKYFFAPIRTLFFLLFFPCEYTQNLDNLKFLDNKVLLSETDTFAFWKTEKDLLGVVFVGAFGRNRRQMVKTPAAKTCLI